MFGKVIKNFPEQKIKKIKKNSLSAFEKLSNYLYFYFTNYAVMKKRILGVDPGTNILGYAVIEVENKTVQLLTLDVIKLGGLKSHFDRLNRIYTILSEVIDRFEPQEMAIEAPFYGKNPQSMLKLGRAQGVAIVAAMQKGLPVFEYAPLKIKMSITGNGRASKEQVALMLQSQIKGKFEYKYLDETDAVAAAVCHFYQNGSIGKSKGYSSWEDFARKNNLL